MRPVIVHERSLINSQRLVNNHVGRWRLVLVFQPAPIGIVQFGPHLSVLLFSQNVPVRVEEIMMAVHGLAFGRLRRRHGGGGDVINGTGPAVNGGIVRARLRIHGQFNFDVRFLFRLLFGRL